jgi:hypothetical protein
VGMEGCEKRGDVLWKILPVSASMSDKREEYMYMLRDKREEFMCTLRVCWCGECRGEPP